MKEAYGKSDNPKCVYISNASMLQRSKDMHNVHINELYANRWDAI